MANDANLGRDLHRARSRHLVSVGSLEDFIDAAGEYPRSAIVLSAEVPPDAAEVHRYCRALGGIRAFDSASVVRTVRNDPSVHDSTAMSLDPLSLHTDGAFLATPPSRFLLSFSATDGSGGGVSTFMPLARIVAAAPGWALEALFGAHYLFVRTYDGDLSTSHTGPVLYQSGGSVRIRWRSDHLWRPQAVQPHGTKAQDAVDWLHEFLGSTEPVAYVARPGDTLLVPNTVMLHGRTGLSPGSRRTVLRAWLT